jgi:ABC-type Fe2+-enterobactin transport system substrate-binding protein
MTTSIAPTSPIAAVNASTAPVRFSFLGGAKSTATAWTRSCRDREVTSLYRGEPVIPALLSDQADGREVRLPGQITSSRE